MNTPSTTAEHDKIGMTTARRYGMTLEDVADLFSVCTKTVRRCTPKGINKPGGRVGKKKSFQAHTKSVVDTTHLSPRASIARPSVARGFR